MWVEILDALFLVFRCLSKGHILLSQADVNIQRPPFLFTKKNYLAVTN